MKIKEFTEEEMSQLRQSEYILDVTPQLEHELAYTRQELEFVKKIIAAGREERK